MDEKEKEEVLYRLDERTKRVDEHLTRLDDRIQKNRENLQNHDKRIDDNEASLWAVGKVVQGIGGALLALFSGLGAKLAGLF